MKGLWRVSFLAGVIVVTLFAISESVSQEAGGEDGGRRRGRDREGGGRFDPAEMMERQMGRFQERLGFSDTEWTAVKPRVQSVAEKQMAARMAGMGGRRGLFGGPPPGGPGGGP